MKKLTKHVLRDLKIKSWEWERFLYFFTWIKYNIGSLGTVWFWECIEANVVSATLKQVPLNLFSETEVVSPVFRKYCYFPLLLIHKSQTTKGNTWNDKKALLVSKTSVILLRVIDLRRVELTTTKKQRI